MPGKPLGFDVVCELARTLPGVEESAGRGAPSLKIRGKLLACPAIHKSAEPNSLVVKIGFDERAELIAADPDVYYVTDHYVKYPSVLVRMSRIHKDAVRSLLGMACRFVSGEAGTGPTAVNRVRKRTSRRTA
ncbi:MAG TPA: hypothetical protein VK789_24405 [Bryobacteraceae bacterium]|nr:hypothetical protein [Bryobacteraceae bacterium]